MRCALLAVLVPLLLATACSAPYDDDGEASPVITGPVVARVPGPNATPVVVDTDLGADDLAALAFMLRHPAIDVRAITVAGAGLVACDPGVDIVADVLTGLAVSPIPIACATTPPGPGGRKFPDQWRQAAERGSGINRHGSTLAAQPGGAARLISRLARRRDDLVLVALGPMTNPAHLAEAFPEDFARLAGVHAMGGSVAGDPIDGIAEWNAAADPQSFETVLAAGVPVTIVPEDAVPVGTPEVLRTSPVAGQVAARSGLDTWWDLATAAALVAPGGTRSSGRWVLDPDVPGRLARAGKGGVRVVRSLSAAELQKVYAAAFG